MIRETARYPIDCVKKRAGGRLLINNNPRMAAKIMIGCMNRTTRKYMNNDFIASRRSSKRYNAASPRDPATNRTIIIFLANMTMDITK
jgi:hypothetical protein